MGIAKMTAKDILQTLVAIGIIVGMALGAISYFATAEDLKLTQQRLDQKIIYDRVVDLKRMIYQMEDKYKGQPCEKWPEKDRNIYRELKMELEEANKQREKMK